MSESGCPGFEDLQDVIYQLPILSESGGQEKMVRKLTERFEKALTCATQLHSLQFRKQTDIPYISHLLSVAALVLEDGCNEDEAIAALLHDAVEDQGE